MSTDDTPPPTYLFQMHHGTGVAVRTLLNDLPMYAGPGQQNITVSGWANHLLLPGENHLRVEIYPAPRPADATTIEGPVQFTLRLDEEEGTIVHRVTWPDCWEGLPVDQQILPFVLSSRFVVDERLGRPAYWDAPPTQFPLEGTPEQHLAVQEIYRAFRQRDVEAFFDANALKLAERQRAYGGSDFDSSAQKKKLAGYFGRAWALRSSDLGDLTFESRAGGRVAFVTRKDGGRAVEAVAVDDPSETFAADLFLTRHDGRWRVFR